MSVMEERGGSVRCGGWGEDWSDERVVHTHGLGLTSCLALLAHTLHTTLHRTCYTAHEHFNTRHCKLARATHVVACPCMPLCCPLSPSLAARLSLRSSRPSSPLSAAFSLSPHSRLSPLPYSLSLACVSACVSYPGGCGVPSAQASATSSPLSPPGIVSNSVAWYVTPTTATTQRVCSSPIWVLRGCQKARFSRSSKVLINRFKKSYL